MLVIFRYVSAIPGASLPSVWVIAAYRAGEQSQLLALAEALGWPYEVKRLCHRRAGALYDVTRASGLCGIDRARSDALAPPWPEVVIAAGMRNEPVCRWIRHASGGRTRIVHIGRPWARLACFDLVVTTPQYRLPEAPNVLQNTLTLHRVTPARLAEAHAVHGERLARLPSPRIALVVGGPSGPYHFGARSAARLARAASTLARSLGGSLLVSTSSRTPALAVRALREAIEVPHEFYAWRAGDAGNPYYAYLASAERLIVSFDSIAMISEACATGKPVYLFDPQRPDDGEVAPVVEHSARALGYRALLRWGPRRLGRDITLVHDRLLAAGRVTWLGEGREPHELGPWPDIERAVARVRALLGERR